MAVAQQEFKDSLQRASTMTRDDIVWELKSIEIEMARSREILSSAAKALSKLRARKMALESKLK